MPAWNGSDGSGAGLGTTLGPSRAHTWAQACVFLENGIWPVTDDFKAPLFADLREVSPDYPVSNYTTVQFDSVLPIEESYFKKDPYTFYLWITNYWTISIYASILYFFVIFGLQRWMRDRKPYDLKMPLFFWNLGLALFSIVGAHRMLSELLFVLNEHGFQHSVCVSSYAFCNAVTAVWTWWFAHSKLLELGDTVFIVLRKRHLMFLHWYHHITVLVYTWFSMSNFSSHGRWFVTCNLAIHAVMYSYYAVRALGIRIPRSISMAVTSSQLLQMILGIFISVSAYGFKRRGVPCSATTANLFASSLMYMSYFLLFLKFFFDAYLAKSLARAKKTDGDQLVKAAMTKFVEKETADVAARLRRIRHAATY